MARTPTSGKTDRPARRWRLRRDAVNASARAGGRRALRKGRRGLRAVAPYALVAGVVVVSSVAVWALLGSALLGVRTISVRGERTVTTEQVARAAAIPVGTPLARLDTAAAADRIGKLPSVASVHVRRAWPNTVVVTIAEREAVAVAARGVGYVLVDAEGYPFRAVPSRPAGLPLIRVPDPEAGDPATRAALTVASALTPQLRELVSVVVAATPQRIEVRLTDRRVVFWGAPEDSPRKARIATALLGESGTRIDVSSPDVVTVR
ncbi:cell division protein FtsQ/DivIB [Cryptosporangium aurantiacum]|uniref:Cell division protein FtsQ n=1 Tax=Cryptosporangium aurantiacum TaxID=134849 RepID=A0A1M7I5F4_9ACTN|nr:FtsQ-type POTRA domain-containing protein [Cryptosporangium aurantiacum]SHM35868.1 cell division protein FtsQ [Cryptosporangium aurantiacum]